MQINSQKKEVNPAVYDEIALESIEKFSKTSGYRIIKRRFRFFFGLIFFIFFALLIFNINDTFSSFACVFATANFIILLIYAIADLLFQYDYEQITPILMNNKLPSYSILIPLKNEIVFVPYIIDSIKKIKYKTDRLQVIIIIEEKDQKTLKAINEQELPPYFQILIIPAKKPFTKGRALQHALPHIKGEYTTVYDVEDTPDPEQLLKALTVFNSANENICLQAIQHVEMSNESILQKFYFSEYYSWFHGFISRCSLRNVPFGLGGNSYHLKTDILKNIGGWDPFNVTEDAELSVLLMKNGIKTILFNSITLEYCTLNTSAWIRQRIRWNKGLLITFLSSFLSSYTNNGFFLWMKFWLRIISGIFLPISTMIIIINTAFRISIYIQNGSSQIESSLLIILFSQFILSYFVYILLLYKSFMRGGIKINLLVIFLYNIFYWFLYNIAGLLAFFEFLFNPIKWNKTEHHI